MVGISVRYFSVAALVGCLSFLPSQAQPAEPVRAAVSRPAENCLEVETEEKLAQLITVGSGTPFDPLRKVGDAEIFHTRSRDGRAESEGVGHAVATHIRKPDGAMMVRYTHTGVLPEGTVDISALIPLKDLQGGKAVSFTIHGTSGKYAGKSGTGTWQLTSVPPTRNSSWTTKATLCD